ncbi:MAG TPA: NAD(P)-dependent oxidoreductase [Burkholderiales bacterium]|nr:NAD(P)-dependent oxidoreductase [Burkholderiales bacterium]
MRVLFRFDASEALASKAAALSGDGTEILTAPESDDAAYDRLLPGIDVLWHVLRPVNEDQINRASSLKLIQKIGSGLNTIDVEAAKRRGIAVCNLPGTNSRAVAEMALLLMLACLRRLSQLNSYVRTENGWQEAWQLQDHFGELGGRTVGLIGYGEVPKILKPILEAMGATVLYWSRSQRNSEFKTLVATSDIVSLHLPLTSQTEKIIDARAMKAGAILVNTARGGLVDEECLIQSLKTGHLAAAGLDVFPREPPPADHPLLKLPNVVCAPHLAWLTQETLERSLGAALENVKRLEAGRPLLNRIV